MECERYILLLMNRERLIKANISVLPLEDDELWFALVDDGIYPRRFRPNR